MGIPKQHIWNGSQAWWQIRDVICQRNPPLSIQHFLAYGSFPSSVSQCWVFSFFFCPLLSSESDPTWTQETEKPRQPLRDLLSASDTDGCFVCLAGILGPFGPSRSSRPEPIKQTATDLTQHAMCLCFVDKSIHLRKWREQRPTKS